MLLLIFPIKYARLIIYIIIIIIYYRRLNDDNVERKIKGLKESDKVFTDIIYSEGDYFKILSRIILCIVFIKLHDG